MAGHGRRISSAEDLERPERSVLPISLTSRLQSNTWRQVFTSLRPLVAQTRQRTLSTYARRLHQRQQDGRTQRTSEGNSTGVTVPTGDSRTWPSHIHHPAGLRAEVLNENSENNQSQNVVIDIENSMRGASPAVLAQSIPVPPLVPQSHEPNSDSFTNSSSLLASAADSQNNNVIPSSFDPLIPSLNADGSLDDNTSASDSSSEDGTGSNSNGDRSASESLTELLSQFPEVRSFFVVAWHYCLFLLIILAKAVFDHFTGLMVILTLIIGFLWSNNILKKAVARQGRRPIKPLLALLVNLPAGVFLLFYSYRNDKLFYSVLLIPPDQEGLGVMDLMWIVIVSDYVLKLVTVLLKTLLTLLPHSLMHSKNR
ncbi:RING finger and transmembrane domain-containing protein 2, partial [Halocaridina rubra]